MKYVAKRDCVYKGRLWLAGEEADFCNSDVPEHFSLALNAKEKLAGRCDNVEGDMAGGAVDMLSLDKEYAEAPCDAPQAGDLESKTLKELKEIAEHFGIEAPAKINKTDLIALIRGDIMV